MAGWLGYLLRWAKCDCKLVAFCISKQQQHHPTELYIRGRPQMSTDVFMLASYSWIGWAPFTWTILTVLMVVYYWMWSQSRTVRLVNALPGPDFLPFLGNFLDFNVDLDGVCAVIC